MLGKHSLCGLMVTDWAIPESDRPGHHTASILDVGAAWWHPLPFSAPLVSMSCRVSAHIHGSDALGAES